VTFFSKDYKVSIPQGKVEQMPDATNHGYLLGHSSNLAVQALERTLRHIAPTHIPVMLVGESGTGKEVVARLIHQLSCRSSEPFAKAICGSRAGETLAAYFNRPDGAKANGSKGLGTVFLKEVSDLDSASQRNLLCALLENDLSAEDTVSGPRIISSTTRTLEEEARAGRFRAELYYRISGSCLRLPSLRERKEDIPALADLLLKKHSSLLGQPCPDLNADDYSILQSHSWPGNIRELENVARKIVVLNDPSIVLSEFSSNSAEPRSPALAAKGSILKAATRAASRRAERQLILDALAKTRWNRKRAAQELQISYKALLYKLKEIGADEPDHT
jgi:two-component system response regulator AtoC